MGDVVIQNGSGQPVYNIVVGLRWEPEDPPNFPLPARVLPPGKWTFPHPQPGNLAEVGFTDGTGRTNWLRKSDGTLEEIGTNALAYFGLDREGMRPPGDEGWNRLRPVN